MGDELIDQIAENATAPAKASGDRGSMEQHPLPDQIEAAKFVAARDAVKGRPFPVRHVKFSPPGGA
jgi:hypothetical protein